MILAILGFLFHPSLSDFGVLFLEKWIVAVMFSRFLVARDLAGDRQTE
jgi:hypothetical protein